MELRLPMNVGQLDDLIPLIALMIPFTALMIPIVAIWTAHRRKRGCPENSWKLS